jgi:phosphopantothenoylcysteine decarboxylase/phosphopantothenate--cysteine ligase
VVSAEEMYNASVSAFQSCHIAVLAAAVADFRPAKTAKEKIKKSASVKGIELVPTRDIALELGRVKKKGQFIVGFALETENGPANAKEKLKRKNFDLVVLNNPREKGAGFGHDTNRVKIMDKSNKTLNFELKSKGDVARDIVGLITERIK